VRGAAAIHKPVVTGDKALVPITKAVPATTDKPEAANGKLLAGKGLAGTAQTGFYAVARPTNRPTRLKQGQEKVQQDDRPVL